jgi:sensor histidine kinase YesM
MTATFGKGKFSLKPHIIFWALFASYEILVTYSLTFKFAPLLDYITYYTFNISLFYIHAQWISKNSSGNKFFNTSVVVFTLIELIIYLIVKYLLTLLYIKLGIYLPTQLTGIWIFIRASVWRAVYIIGLSTAYGFAITTLNSRKQVADLQLSELQTQIDQERLEKELLKSEIAFRKAQIDPHFVFNSLSFIHNYISVISESAGELIITLSDVMRYALAEPEKDGKVDLEAEIEHIENYISLNQHRFNQKLYIDFHIDGHTTGIRIIPMVLITIVENIFKYALLNNPEKPAVIHLTVENNELKLSVKNHKTVKKNVHSTGIGMHNIEKRLELEYPGQYYIHINQDQETYYLDFKINLL